MEPRGCNRRHLLANPPAARTRAEHHVATWLDPAAAHVVAAVAVKEGRASWRSEGCYGN
jgi:hypothetical protein